MSARRFQRKARRVRPEEAITQLAKSARVDLDRLGDEDIEQRFFDQMNKLAPHLDRYFNGDKRGDEREVGFVLLVTTFGDQPGRCNFISNGLDRKDVVALFKEMIERFEGR